MSGPVNPTDLVRWCAVPVEGLVDHPERRVPLAALRRPPEMGRLMAESSSTRSSAPSGGPDVPRRSSRAAQRLVRARSPTLVNARRVTSAHVEVFHMDECLDWEGSDLPRPTRTASAVSWSGTSTARRPRAGRAGGATGTGRSHAARASSPRDLLRDTGRPGVRAAGAGRPRRVQPGSAPPVQPALSRAAAAVDRARAGEQRRHGHRARPAHVRRRLPVRPADVRDAGHARDPGRTAHPAVQRHRRLEADCPARRVVQPGHRRVPDHAPAGAPGRAAHRDGRDGDAPDQPAPRVGPRFVDEAALRRRRRHRWHRVGHLPRAGRQPHPRAGGEPAGRAAGPARLLQAAHRLPLRAAAAGARGAGRSHRQGRPDDGRSSASWGRCGPPASTPHL